MTKYDEIMEKITLSPEARDRIIDNITEAVSKEDRPGRVKATAGKKNLWKRYLAVAACCLLVFAGVRTALDSGMLGMGSAGSSSNAFPEQNLAVQPQDAAPEESAAEDHMTESDVEAAGEKDAGAVLDMRSFESLDELSDHLGFSAECPELRDISEEDGLSDVSYIAYGNGMGEVVYSSEDARNYFRKAEGTEDISGDYNEYEYKSEFDGEVFSGTLSGDSAGSYKLAVWTGADGFTYAAYVNSGLTEEEWASLIESCRG